MSLSRCATASWPPLRALTCFSIEASFSVQLFSISTVCLRQVRSTKPEEKASNMRRIWPEYLMTAIDLSHCSAFFFLNRRW